MATRLDNPSLVVIVGETASGKSELAVQLAERFNGEIIAADSWTVYKDFTIGTAKPDADTRSRVPHYLLDIADPEVGFNAADYKRLAIAAIAEIAGRHKLPILVGGTGLYVDSVLFDYTFLPPATPEIRSRLNEKSVEELLALVNQAGYGVEGIDVRNKRRLIRLIESKGLRPGRAQSMRLNTLVIGIPVEREELRARISARVDAMLTAGLADEVDALRQIYGWDVEPMKGIGYREFREYFEGSQSAAQTRERIITSSLNLAKRQRTWFKRNKSIHWLSKQDEAVDLITTFLNK